MKMIVRKNLDLVESEHEPLPNVVMKVFELAALLIHCYNSAILQERLTQRVYHERIGYPEGGPRDLLPYTRVRDVAGWASRVYAIAQCGKDIEFYFSRRLKFY